MKHFVTSHILLVVALIGAAVCPARSADSQATRKRATELANQGDLTPVRNWIDSEQRRFDEQRDLDALKNLVDIAYGLIANGEENAFWLAREVLWSIILQPDTLDIPKPFAVTYRKGFATSAASNIVKYGSRVGEEGFAAARTDTAALYTEYARCLQAQVIVGYRDKPIPALESGFVPPRSIPTAPTASDAAEGKRQWREVQRNQMENYRQQYLREALRELRDFHLVYLVEAYSRPPEATTELSDLMNVMSLTPAQREKVLQDIARHPKR